MSRFHFTKPSCLRMVLSIVVVYAAASLVSGTALLVSAATDPYPYSVGEYVQLYIWFVLLWGQAYLLIPWFITIPVIFALGVLIASIRRRETGECSEQTPTARPT